MPQTSEQTATTQDLELWKELGQQLRVDSIRATTAAGSGHPTSSMSAADLMAVLLAKYLRYDFKNPQHANNDHIVFSKGHASPLLYAMYKAAGAIDDAELMTLRKKGSRLEGHPVPHILPWVEFATGSLGQGLPYCVGLATAAKYLDKLPYRTWVLCGDSEMAEGSMWEAFEHAAFYKLDNLIAVIDMNRLGQRGQTMHGWDSKSYADRARAFGCHVIEIDGHDVKQIDAAYAEAIQTTGKPTVIVAKTEKGHGVSFLANKDGWHGKALKPDEAEKALQELGGPRNKVHTVRLPEDKQAPALTKNKPQALQYDKPIATRQAYGEALKALGDARGDIVAVDGEVSNSTFAEIFGKAHPDRFFEQYIAEQQMVASAVGMAFRGYTVFSSTFAAFFSRAYDFIRMAAISRSNIRLAGSHAGCSIGEDGPSQMALEDLAMMRAVDGSTVLYPSDGVSAAALTFQMADQPGISYLRTTREKTPILYGPTETFTIGGSQTLRRSDKDVATILAAGITLHEALKAYELLKAEGLNARVIDVYSIKPIDRAMLKQCARETRHFITVEDHWPEGGLGDAVLEGLCHIGEAFPTVRKMAVKAMPGSAPPDQLMDDAGISARHIVEAVRQIAKA